MLWLYQLTMSLIQGPAEYRSFQKFCYLFEIGDTYDWRTRSQICHILFSEFAEYARKLKSKSGITDQRKL